MYSNDVIHQPNFTFWLPLKINAALSLTLGDGLLLHSTAISRVFIFYAHDGLNYERRRCRHASLTSVKRAMPLPGSHEKEKEAGLIISII